MGVLSDINPLYVGCGLLGTYLIYFILYPWFISPLKHIPGPAIAAYTKWWLVYKTVKGVRAKTIHDLHVKYGSWVRIAPNEVSTADSQAIVPIYGVNSNFIKTEFYTYQLRGIPELFTMANRKQHATRRRQLSHLFSMSTITEYEPTIAEHVKVCMDLIADEGHRGVPSNLYDWWHFLSMDIVCDLSFGRTFDMLHQGATNAYVKDLYGSLQIEPVRWHFGWLNQYAKYAPLKFVRDAEACSVRAMNRAVGIVQDYIQNQDASKGKKKDLLQKMLDARDDEGHPLPSEELGSEAAGFILAGSHTTSSSLTWIVWRLLRHPRVLEKMTAELDEAFAGAPRNTVPKHAMVERLPYLECIIKEGLRIDTAVPGSTPRYVPPEGSDINGVRLPPRTIVSAQAYSCHRDPEVYPKPDEFLPERWLNETADMKRFYIPFGADGPRKCIGIHLAYMELRVILASLFYRFDMKLLGNPDNDMELDEFWLANPIGQKLNVMARQRPEPNARLVEKQ